MAKALGLSVQRVYQLDAELQPVIAKRGEKMTARWYRPAIVEAEIERRRASRAGVAGAVGANAVPAGASAVPAGASAATETATALARSIAARVLTWHADNAPFFADVPPADTEAVRDALRALADELA